jgi:hypothetical protein
MTEELWVADLVRIGALSRPVHAGMIVCVIALWLALAEWSAWRGSALARIAEKLYGLGAIAMIGAALINGFAIDHLANNALQDGAEGLRDAARVIPLAWSLNQTLAGFGVFALSGGIVVARSVARAERVGASDGSLRSGGDAGAVRCVCVRPVPAGRDGNGRGRIGSGGLVLNAWNQFAVQRYAAQEELNPAPAFSYLTTC